MSKTKKIETKIASLLVDESDTYDDYFTSAHISDFDNDALNESIVNKNAMDNVNNEILNKTKINVSRVMPWIEKYRPKLIHDVILDSGTQSKISNIIEEFEMPNIIITGTPGVGKTTTIKCIARSFYGKYMKDYVLELNASDERGIKTVQDTIIDFCKKKIIINDSQNIKCAEHKMIILDEADNMTQKAQRLINTLMEKYHKTTRFAFTCNNSHDIIESIQSRCIIFRYHRVDKNSVVANLKKICAAEQIPHEDDALEEIAIYSQGDMRNAINNLQLTYNSCNGEIIVDGVRKMCDKPQPFIIRDILNHCVKGDIKQALTSTIHLKTSGYSGSDIMLAMINTIKLSEHLEFNEATKIKLMEHVAKTAYIISKGIDTNLQLSGCIASMSNDTYS